MSLAGSCHCGAVRVTVPEAPRWVGSCNCSICRKLGWPVAFYPDDGSVQVAGETDVYIWGDRMIGLHRCKTCGVVTHWRTLGEDFGKMGVNARLFDGYREGPDGARSFDGAPLEVRFMDNAG